jgi:zinc protease
MRYNFIVFVSFLCLGGHAVGAPWPASDIPPDPSVTFRALPNGMRFAIMRNETPKHGVSIRFRIAAGSMHETAEQRGVAHFLEHMAFRGSTHVTYGDNERILSEVGVNFREDVNASTGQNETVYELDLPQSSAHATAAALGYIREIASNLALDHLAAKTEAGVILSERWLRENAQFRARQTQLNRLLVDEHATALPGGNPAVIANAPTDQIRAFYHSYYRPERATLIIVGDIDPALVEKQIRLLFLDWIPPNELRKDPALSIPFNRGLEAGIYTEPGAPSDITLSWISPPQAKPRDRAAERRKLIEHLALDILDRRLRDQSALPANPFDVARSFYGNPLQAAKVTSIVISYGTRGWQRALTAAETIRSDMFKNGVRQSQVKRAVLALHGVLVAAVASASKRPSRALAAEILDVVGKNEIYTSPMQHLAALDKDMAGISAKEVTASFRALFPGEPVIFISGSLPVEGGEGAVKSLYLAVQNGTLPAERPQRNRSAITKWSHSNFGKPGTVREIRKVSDLGVTYLRFANGVKLTVRPSKLRVNQVFVSVKIGNGRLDLPKDRVTACWAAPGTLVFGGLSDMPFSDMERALASKTYSIDPTLDEDGLRLLGRTVPHDLVTQLQVFAAYLSSPGFRQEGFEETKADLITQLGQMEVDPSALFAAKAPQYLHAEDMRWNFPSSEQISSTKFQDVRALLAPILAHGPIDVVITGDISVDAATKALATTLAALPVRDEPRTFVTPDNSPQLPAGGTAMVLSYTGSPRQNIISVLWPTAGRFRDVKGNAIRSIMSSIMEERLFNKLRGLGLSYEAEVGEFSSKVFDYGFIQAVAQVGPDQTKEFTDAVDQIVRDLKEGNIPAEELRQARSRALESLKKERQTNKYWISALDDTAEHIDKLNFVREYRRDLREVTLENIAAMARQYLVASNMIKLSVERAALHEPAPVK